MPTTKRQSCLEQSELDEKVVLEHPPKCLLWNFRLVLECCAQNRFYDQDGELDRGDAQRIGIPDEAMDFDRVEMQRYLKQQIKVLERQRELGIPLSLITNTQQLAQLVGLNNTG